MITREGHFSRVETTSTGDDAMFEDWARQRMLGPVYPQQSCVGRIEYIGVDFDGTIVEHRYPDIGPENAPAFEYLRKFTECGAKLILCTMRGGDSLCDAIDYLDENGIELYGVNENPKQISWTSSPKPWCHLYIDDAALGCPLVKKDRMAVDWSVVGPQVLWLLKNHD